MSFISCFRLGRPSLAAAVIAISCAAAQSVPTNVAASGLNVRDDAGAAAYASGSRSDTSLVSADLAERFPVGQRARIHVLGGGVRGFGMLAEFGPDGPGEIVVARATKKTGYEPYTPFALARVFDPQGNLAAVEEFTDQPDGTQSRILKVNTRMAGIWRVSFSGGRAGDQVEIRLPKTDTWGVRGEMALGVEETTPRPAYLWIPPTSVKLLVGIESGSPEGIELQDAATGAVLGKPENDPTGRPGRILTDSVPAGKIARLVMPASFAGALVFQGAPDLLCPTPEAAMRLQGGAVESDGLWVAGPLQARIHDWMVRAAAKVDRKPVFTFPSKIPDGLPDPWLQVLMFGKYGFANCLGHLISTQNGNLDPASPWLGTFYTDAEKPTGPNWTNFWAQPAVVFFDSAALAAAATFESPLNPAYHNEDVIRRATLGSFANLMAMQGDDLIRQGADLETTRYPMIHSFFIYPPALAESYLELKPLLDPEARELWRQALMATGDKLGDYQGYESNQWSHMILGHLDTYLATGEKRFLGYFEREAAAFFDGAFGTASKFGQHPAGYFLEEYGPDGNYDHLSAFNLVTAYYEYRKLPEANPALVEKMRAGIGKNIRFSSFFWLPDPDGRIVSPTSFNCRTTAEIQGLGYPGMIMAKADFPLGLARFNLTPSPKKGLGDATTFSFIANTDTWVLDVIRDGLRRGPDGLAAYGGHWVPAIALSYSQPARVTEPGVIPVRDEGKTWQLPGMLAWNRAGFYGVVFADVAGADRSKVLQGFTGGGPAALWTPATGAFLLGVAPGKPYESAHLMSTVTLSDAKALTFACVYGETDAGVFFYSGKERAKVAALSAGRSYEVDAKMDKPFASLKWRYDFQPDDLRIQVSLNAVPWPKAAFVNLPLRVNSATKVSLASPQSVVIEGAGGSVTLSWDGPAEGKLMPSLNDSIHRLVIPLPDDGSPLTIHVQAETR